MAIGGNSDHWAVVEQVHRLSRGSSPAEAAQSLVVEKSWWLRSMVGVCSCDNRMETGGRVVPNRREHLEPSLEDLSPGSFRFRNRDEGRRGGKVRGFLDGVEVPEQLGEVWALSFRRQ